MANPSILNYIQPQQKHLPPFHAIVHCSFSWKSCCRSDDNVSMPGITIFLVRYCIALLDHYFAIPARHLTVTHCWEGKIDKPRLLERRGCTGVKAISFAGSLQFHSRSRPHSSIPISDYEYNGSLNSEGYHLKSPAYFTCKTRHFRRQTQTHVGVKPPLL